MEHETFVPAPPARLALALRSPAVVAASLPGWQPDAADAGADAAAGQSGRLRLRVAGSTITYRADLSVSGDASPFTMVARGAEVRGDGRATATVTVSVEPADQPEPGATLLFRAAGSVTGRLTGYDDAVVEAALRRLLDRFAAALAENAPEEGTDAGDPAGRADTKTPADEPAVGPAERPADGPAGASADRPADDTADDAVDEPDIVDEAVDEPDVVDDLGEPAPPAEGEEDFELVEVEVEVPESAAALDDLVTPAEAAHARRTMIGRSAEEVDHAPPRGRYAPVPAPDGAGAAATLRWAAPAAAALLASAVVVGRVLRRRR
jgi:carbon monoxide dehydrogenase subunit G